MIDTQAQLSALVVSIHAPAGGATFNGTISRSKLYVSIHAPAGGATGLYYRADGSRYSFNPRTRRGCDKNNQLGN